MLHKLRASLTIWYVGVTLLLYACGSAFALLVLQNSLTNSLDEELNALVLEIQPAIEYVDNKPTLSKWAQKAKTNHLSLLATVQLYSHDGNLLESWGPLGLNKLLPNATGEIHQTKGPHKDVDLQHQEGVISGITDSSGEIKVRAIAKQLNVKDPRSNYLQLELSTKHRDDAIRQLTWIMMLVGPLLAMAVGLAGYLFAKKATAPVEKSISMLRRFVADAGHEFNTPISIIEASLQTLEATLADDDQNKEVMAMIGRASDRMKNLAKDLVLLARVEAADLALEKVSVPLDELCEPLILEFKSLAQSKGIKLSSNTVPNIKVLGNPESLSCMLSNLLENAVHYTESGGTIKVNIETHPDDTVTFKIEDTGIGIPEECLEHVFESFYRADKSRSRAQGGSGLGLSIVSAIVQAHKGRINVESKAGEGSIFTVVLPYLT